MQKDENTLKQHVKSLLEEDRNREVARRIERASSELLKDHHFAFQREAEALAEVDLAKLDQFIERVKRIRADLEAEYFFAAKALFEGDDK